jgi:pimeloyl-ACP methyl ester carboxylesterase
LSVPEDWSQPGGARIQVYYYARIERDPSTGAAIKPTLFFNGGPAADSHSSYDLLEHRSSAQTLSMVYMDQRGTGCSDPYPVLPVAAATAKRLTLYGSRAIVRDAEAIRAHLLGSQPWTAFGQSFGGEIVHRYVEMFPEGLSAAFAHGATLVSDPIAKISGRLSSQLRVSQDYFAAHPDDAARLKSIRAQIPDSQCFDDGTSRVCGSVVVDGVTVLLGFRTEWDSMHEWLGELMGSSGRLDQKTLGQFVRTFVFGVYASNDFAASVLSYWEVVPGYTDALGCQAATARLKQAAPNAPANSIAPDSSPSDPATWPINECRLLSAIRAPWDALVSQLGAGDPFSLKLVASQLAQHPQLPLYLYSGGEDVFVPIALFSEETQALGSRIHYLNFPKSGHDGFYTEQQVWDDLNSI